MNTAAMSPKLAYEMFVGCSIKEFLDGHPLEDAINALMSERWWESQDSGTPAPENLPELIREYVEDFLDS